MARACARAANLLISPNIVGLRLAERLLGSAELDGGLRHRILTGSVGRRFVVTADKAPSRFGSDEPTAGPVVIERGSPRLARGRPVSPSAGIPTAPVSPPARREALPH